MQRDIGKTRPLSGQKDSWASGIRTLLSHSRGALGRASVAGKSVSFRPQNRSFSPFRFRFFEMTGLAMLTSLIQRYRVEPHPKFAGESFEQLKERYSQATEMLTLK